MLGGHPRPDGRRARRSGLDRRPQPAEPRPGRAQHRRGPPRGHVRRRGLAGAHRQVRAAAARAVRPPRRRRPTPPHRRDAQPRVPTVAALHPRPAARTAARGRRQAGRARRRAGRRHPARRHPQPRRPRHLRPAGRVHLDRRHAPDGDLRLHRQRPRPGLGRPPAEPLLAADRRADGGARPAGRGSGRRPVGAVHRRFRRGDAVPRDRRTLTPRAGRAAPGARAADRHRPHALGHRHHAGRIGPGSARPHPRRPRRRQTDRHPGPGRLLLHQPRRLGEQGRRLVRAGAGRLVRRRPRNHPALARTS